MMTHHPAAPEIRRSFLLSLVIAAILVGPVLVLQFVNRPVFQEGFPFVLFSFMALHSVFIGLAVTPALRRLWAERRLSALQAAHWAGIAVGLVLAVGYTNVILDQLPCFLGVPNCD